MSSQTANNTGTAPKTPEEIIAGLSRTAEDFFSKDEFVKLLKKGKQIRMKYGVDLTAPLLHTGHAVNLWMYRDLQELGHRVVFLLGDFTTQIGDPTGRSKLRPVLSQEEIEANAEEFLRQVKMVLLDDPNLLEIRRNSEWFNQMGAKDLLNLLSAVTHDRLISRDMFRKRIAEGSSIYMHEMLYPILQGYDSVMLEADLTIVGSDQLFNEMMGRFFQERAGKTPQVIITSQVTPGIDGKEKQSKSIGNYIGLGHSPRDKFGRVMSIPDNLIGRYLTIYTKVPMSEVAELTAGAEKNPMEVKRRLAREIVARYHGEQAGLEEDQWFTNTFSKQEAPPDAPLVSLAAESLPILEILKRCVPGKSNSEFRRLLEQNAVSVEGEKVTDPHREISLSKEPLMLQVGKRSWFRISQ